MADTSFVPVGEHETDAFISDALKKKFPGIEDKAAAEMEKMRSEGDTTFGTNPMTQVLVGLWQSKKPDMKFEDFMTKLRAGASKSMIKHKIKPYSVTIGDVKVAEPKAYSVLRTASQIAKTIVSPLWDGSVGAMRYAASPLADINDPDKGLVDRGILPPFSERERKKAQVEVLTGLIGVGGYAQGAGLAGRAAVGAAHTKGLAGFVLNTLEGGAWGGLFQGAEAIGQEKAAEEVLQAIGEGVKGGATLAGGLGLAGRAVGKYRTWKVEKFMKEIDIERERLMQHKQDMKVSDSLKDLLADGGFANRPPELPMNTKRYNNISLPDNMREMADPERVAFLDRTDALLQEKGMHLDLETGQLTAHPDPTAGAVRDGFENGPPGLLPEVGTPTQAHADKLTPLGDRPTGPSRDNPIQLFYTPEEEVSYRLAYGDKVWLEREAEYDLLPPELKGKVPFLSFVDDPVLREKALTAFKAFEDAKPAFIKKMKKTVKKKGK